jgi:hypothetical protein
LESTTKFDEDKKNDIEGEDFDARISIYDETKYAK